MKRVAAILFFFVLLFNIAGYRIFLYCLQTQHEQALEASFDNKEYADSELVAIRIPFDLPYESNWKDYARVRGQAEINGHVYRYVKCKITGGELVLLCLPDFVSAQLTNAGTEFFKLTNDIGGNDTQKKQPAGNLLKKFTSIFEAVPEKWKMDGVLTAITDFTRQNVPVNSQYNPCVPGKPPRQLRCVI